QTELLALNAGGGLSATWLATWLMTSLIEHQSFWSIGLALKSQSYRHFGIGFAAGTAMVGTITLVEWAVGGIRFKSEAPGGDFSLALLTSLSAIVAVAALNEEMLFRGYPFQRLIEGTGEYTALGISSILFGALHLRNPHSTALSTSNTMLAGVLLSLLYLRT